MKEEVLRRKLMLMKQGELIKKTATLFQLRRRLECSDSNGIAECISCGRKHHYKEMDAGHLVSRRHLGTLLNSNNVNPQCRHCNKWLGGNYTEYRVRLVKKIGKDAVEWLEENRDNLGKVWIRDLLIETYIESKKIIKTLESNQAKL